MSLLTLAIISMTTALLLYTIGVWSERFARHLKPWHLFFFWGGLVLDTAGTEMMRRIAGGRITFDLHGLTGLAALILMALHAVWALVVTLRGRERELQTFHHLSLAVWLLWLIPFSSGVIFNSGLARLIAG